MALSPETRRLLGSIKLRTDARLRKVAVQIALRDLAADGAGDLDDLDLERASEPLEFSTDSVLQTFPYQTSTLASDAWELLWSELIETLIEDQEGAFDGLGWFRFDADKGLVHFRAAEELSEATRLAVLGEESVWSVAMVAGAEGAHIANQQGPLLALPDDAISLSALILSHYGHHALRQAIARSTLEVAFDVAISTAAFEAYQAVVLSLANRLRDVERVEIPLIGSFTASLGVISFDAAEELIDYLIANDRVSW